MWFWFYRMQLRRAQCVRLKGMLEAEANMLGAFPSGTFATSDENHANPDERNANTTKGNLLI